jgi:hypothetical protein
VKTLLPWYACVLYSLARLALRVKINIKVRVVPREIIFLSLPTSLLSHQSLNLQLQINFSGLVEVPRGLIFTKKKGGRATAIGRKTS